jgi:hypothetical protein
MSTPEPTKFVKDAAGVRRISAEWKAWKAAQDRLAGLPPAPDAPPPTAEEIAAAPVKVLAPAMKNAATALPVVTSLQDHQKHMGDTALAPDFQEAVATLHQPAAAQALGLAPEQAVGELSRIFAKYEIPTGMLSKLFGVSNFAIMEFIVDDSGSMDNRTDTKDENGRWMTRWSEAFANLSRSLEILAYVPQLPELHFRFLNRSDHIVLRREPSETPAAFMQRGRMEIGRVFAVPPAHSTPALARILESLGRFKGQAVLRYFFGDGVPDGGDAAVEAIVRAIKTRANPERNPFTFVACTDEDDAVAWMSDCEEQAKFCSAYDDFADEAQEVLRDQGAAFPYTFGMHLVALLVGAFNPDDLDAMDESVPLTKRTLSALSGYELSDQEYNFYFDKFNEAQQKIRRGTWATDALKKDYLNVWPGLRQEFKRAPLAKDVQAVREYRTKMEHLKTPSCCVIA